ncbi:unnamed protein product [Larinioides sclopetarius]|uniref:CXC domain-containing protein n=1 Tax=Larinioides sclopetarius TaxID=280406 RepID=A0AAV2AT03_9ARAC
MRSKDFDWVVFSKTTPLTEELMRSLQDRLDFAVLSQHQTLSEEFIDEFRERPDFEKLWKSNFIGIDNVCSLRTLRACFEGYKVSCCSNQDCSTEEVCCFENPSCEIKCMKPLTNGGQPHFQEDRDKYRKKCKVCPAIAKKKMSERIQCQDCIGEEECCIHSKTLCEIKCSQPLQNRVKIAFEKSIENCFHKVLHDKLERENWDKILKGKVRAQQLVIYLE